MAHQLYVLQVLTFNLLEDRMMTKMDPQDQVGAQPDTVMMMRKNFGAAQWCSGLQCRLIA